MSRGFDEGEYKRHFHTHQESYIRQKLRCVELYHKGKGFSEIAEHLSLHQQSVRKYVNIYISEGFAGLCMAQERVQPSLLTPQQEASFKEVLLHKRPLDMGLEGNIWTGRLMCAYLEKAYGVCYRSGIYDLLERMGLSHQKAHADYGNASPAKQAASIEELKDLLLKADHETAVLKFDEFSICEKPSAYYGWAEKNTRPRFVTNEKKGTEPTGCRA